MEKKVIINEDQFNIEINEWNDFTLGLLKSYSDWKCNGEQVPVAPPVTQSETENQQDINQGVKRNLSPLFPELQSLVKPGEYGYTPIYSPILEHILKSLPDKFTKKEVSESIYNFYNEMGRNIKLTSSTVYGGNYCKYMLYKKTIAEVDGKFVRIKKNQS